MKLKAYDWFVFGLLAVGAISGGSVVALLALGALGLYLIVRRYFHVSTTNGITITPPQDNEFIVSSPLKDGHADIELDVDINYRPAPRHFRFASRFYLESGKSEYEYRIEGTSVSVRLLNSFNCGESTKMEKEWEVRDGVVLESDLRARFEAKQFKLRPIDEDIEALKSQTQWWELTSGGFNGFKYFLLNRCLPVPDARRYLRQELERLKVGNARAIRELAGYGIEPDLNPESIDGWRYIGNKESENAKDTQPFWKMVGSGALGITKVETGQYGRQLIRDLQKLLGE
jgi:hypothetical protein